MSKFRSNGKREMPELNTSSLPDLIFTVLFFFMMVTSMRDITPLVDVKTPTGGSEIVKLEKKSLVSHIYIGPPAKQFRAIMGSADRIQLNEVITDQPEAVREFVVAERESMFEKDKPLMKMSLKVDKNSKMKMLQEVKKQLRMAKALNIVYSATQDNKKN